MVKHIKTKYKCLYSKFCNFCDEVYEGAHNSKQCQKCYSVRKKYDHVIKSADKRGLEFNLNKTAFRNLVLKSCNYCGRESKVPYVNGIDRVDSEVGYIAGNCVPSCGVCNTAKFTMSKEEFFDHIVRIYNFCNLRKREEIIS